MRFILSYLKRYRLAIFACIFIKFLGTIAELVLPSIFEYIIDEAVPTGDMKKVVFWGIIMIAVAGICCLLNIAANRRAVRNARNAAYDIRQDLFVKTSNLSGHAFDTIGLPSLTSRMTSDSYNVQQFCQTFQTLCVRAPFMLVGGVIMMIRLDAYLAMILCLILIPAFFVIYTVSRKGIPLFNTVQDRLDDVVRIMRENITGIRVVKALSKSEYEKKRFDDANEAMKKANIRASAFMALPGPFMNIILNIGLVLVVFIGARRVNDGIIKPGIILAFLTYFNNILHSVQGLNRIFMMISKAAASANRIADVVYYEDEQPVLSEDEVAKPAGDELIRLEDVSFRYNENEEAQNHKIAFNGEQRVDTLSHISFAVKEGESLGIIGPTGSGKSSIASLLMRFYDVRRGAVYIAGRDVRTYDKDELRRLFGVAFQNDTVFNDTLRNNIDFGRGLSDEAVNAAIEDAMAADFIRQIPEGLDYMADIKGANLSGGQRQRILVSRALAGKPKILILDDSSSALDYKTDAALRKAIAENYPGSTTIMIAQRVSSVRNMTNILVIYDGKVIGYGTHDHLMETCPYYRDIANAQMGALS